MPNLGTFTRTKDNNIVNLTLPNPGVNSEGVNAQYNIFENRWYGGTPGWHYKTNIPFGGWSMHNIEAVGYNYGNSLPIRCNWVFHVSYGNGFYQTELSNIYSGLSANRLYTSTDGYVVVVASANTAYYAGWSLNAYSLNPTGPFEVGILAASQGDPNINMY